MLVFDILKISFVEQFNEWCRICQRQIEYL